jgi:uncharacterized membrane protein
MSDLIAVAYPDKETAETVRRTLVQLTVERVIDLADAVVITREQSGRIKLHQAARPAAAGATGGALWGGVIGLLFLAPLFGMAVGAAVGGATGAMSDVGINDGYMRALGEHLVPGGAALIVLVRSSTPDKVLPQIQRFGGVVLQTSLDDESEQRLQDALEAGAPSGDPAAA